MPSGFMLSVCRYSCCVWCCASAPPRPVLIKGMVLHKCYAMFVTDVAYGTTSPRSTVSASWSAPSSVVLRMCCTMSGVDMHAAKPGTDSTYGSASIACAGAVFSREGWIAVPETEMCSVASRHQEIMNRASASFKAHLAAGTRRVVPALLLQCELHHEHPPPRTSCTGNVVARV
eukprot:2051427-Rhodomonas_salina.1